MYFGRECGFFRMKFSFVRLSTAIDFVEKITSVVVYYFTILWAPADLFKS